MAGGRAGEERTLLYGRQRATVSSECKPPSSFYWIEERAGSCRLQICGPSSPPLQKFAINDGQVSGGIIKQLVRGQRIIREELVDTGSP